MKSSNFVIRTSMDKQDYKKYYIMSSFSLKQIIQYIILSLVMTLAVSYVKNDFTTKSIIIEFFFLLIFYMSIIAISVYAKYKGAVKMYDSGVLQGENIISFFEDHLVVQNSKRTGSVNIRYDIMHQIRQTKEYILLYASPSECTVIKKSDINDTDNFINFLQEKFKDKFKK